MATSFNNCKNYTIYIYISTVGKLNIKTIELCGELFNAADIEKKLLSNPDIDEVTVLGLGDTDVSSVLYSVIN